MCARLSTVLDKLASLPFLERLMRGKASRIIAFSITSSVVGCILVLVLTSRGVGAWWANEGVSKGMAPVGLFLDTLAITGRVRPTRKQTAKWTAVWLPSALAGAACTGFVVGDMGLGGLECRIVSGAIMFPANYSAKRLFVYASGICREATTEAFYRLEMYKAVADRLSLIRIGA